MHVDCSVSHVAPSVYDFMMNFIKLFLNFMILEVNFNIYFQSHSYSHSYGMKKRSSGSHKDPLVSSVVSHITVFCVAIKFTDYF